VVVIRILNLCRSSLRPWTQCERRTRPFAPQAESRQASDTLVTKVILGTFGCLPACDRYFIDGWKSEGFKYSYLNSKFVDRVLSFCRDNLGSFREEQAAIESSGRMHYPLMKLVDMYFWQTGYEREAVNEGTGGASRGLTAS
jgi:hypothetical protein